MQLPLRLFPELKEAAAVVDTMEFGPTDPIKEDMWCAVLSLPLNRRASLTDGRGAHREDWAFSNDVSGQAVRQESFWDARGIAKPWEGMPKLTLNEAHTIGATRRCAERRGAACAGQMDMATCFCTPHFMIYQRRATASQVHA